MRRVIVLLGLMLALPAHGQHSASFKLTEHVFNQGGHPKDGVVLVSASFRVKLDSVGEGIAGNALTGPSLRVDDGFVAAYPPPREARSLRFGGVDTLLWDPEKSVGVYNLYRDSLALLPGGYGSCLQSNLGVETATETAVPPQGTGFFYLVTAENRLSEEGTKGVSSAGAVRPNPSPCP